MAEKSWQKLPSALSQQSAACVREVRAYSNFDPREKNFLRCLTNEPVKLTAEKFTEANDEQ